MSYRVSVLQYQPQFLKPEQNFAAVCELLAPVKSDLVVLPELALSGYVFCSQREVAEISETIPQGRIFNQFREQSRQLDLSIVYGFAEKAGDNYYNSCALVNPDGSYFIYRKIHLFYREKLFFCPGDQPFAVHPAKQDVKIGMMICFDWQFPESARSLGLLGAQIICHPSNLVLPWCQEAMKTRSLENRCFSITANRTGTEINQDQKQYFTGMSQILGSKGEILIRMNDTQSAVYTVQIDPKQALDKSVTELNSVYGDRRPNLYHL